METESVTVFVGSLILFIIVILILKFIYKTLQNKSHLRVLNMEEYLPTEEIQTLKQVFYLVMMTLCVIDIFYEFTFYDSDIVYFLIFDMFLSLFMITMLEADDIKSYLLIFALIPFGIAANIFKVSLTGIFIFCDILHILALIYCVRYFYYKFKKYTKSNGLSYTILLLYAIIFFSFLWTMVVESVNPLDALSMVSNAFTSNGYAILGSTIAGKLNSLFLIWSGYVLSGVGTATLTFALVKKYYDGKFEKFKEDQNQRFDELEKLIGELKEKK